MVPATAQTLTVDVVVPALNEEGSLPLVLAGLPRPPVRRVVVADNGSRDRTSAVAATHGAIVVDASARRGYGSACLAGLAWLRAHDPPDVVVFIDADFSDHPDELPLLVSPLLAPSTPAASANEPPEARVPGVTGPTDLVIGSRVLGRREPGALLPQARIGNAVACALIRLLYGHRYTDLGPFRAIRWTALERLGMRDPDFGWTAEMQVKALRHGLAVAEVPVSYRRRKGVSKITGTVSGTVRAGWKILSTVIRYASART